MEENTTIVAIGASAGGLEAIQTFFKHVPENSNVAYVVIQHLSPDYKSLMDELLARYTNIAINIVTDGMVVEKNNIYLIPPRKNMSLFNNKLLLDDQDFQKGHSLPIDIFFKSLAKERTNKAIGVILSGTGSDGTLGSRAIKESGGMIMVQYPEDAKFDGMPRSAISTGVVDYVLKTELMPQELLKYIKHPFVTKNNSLEDILSKDIDVLSRILMVLRDFSGIDFSYYKENTIIRRLERRLSINQYNNLDDYFNFLIESDNEKNILYRELLIGVTRFFRDEETFNFIKEKVIENLVKNSASTTIRIWSAACSTGEEAYSLAILFLEYFEKQNIKKELKIFATDIDKDAIEIASNGFYPDSVVSDIEPKLLTKYFSRKDNGYKIHEKVRKSVIFAKHNVLKDPPFSKIDLISCRNLFIYLKSKIQLKVLSMFYFSLTENGYLMLGSSETIGDMSEAFYTINSKLKIFKYRKGYNTIISRNISLPKQTNLQLQKGLNQNKIFSSIKSDFIIDQVFNFFTPPSVIIDTSNNIIQLINDVNKYLTFSTGRFSNDLFKLVNSDLRIILSNIIRRLKADENHVIFKDITNIKGFEDQVLDIEGRKIIEPKENEKFIIVSFISKNVIKNESPTIIKVDKQFKDKIIDLETELQFTKENLQATVEELETSNEELQSSNEELIASNEELQSTNEELQSVNEELFTVNSEYQDKIQELTTLNNDIQNLLKNTQIGTLYLDNSLRIRKLTSHIQKLTNILDSDIGRPIQHISVSEYYPEISNDILKVKQTLKPINREIKNDHGKWFLVTIKPYRNQDNAIDGIIVTFVDITHLKEAKIEAEKMSDKLQMALNMGSMAWWEMELPSGKVNYDDNKIRMLGFNPSDFSNYKDFMKLIHPDDYDRTMQAMADHLSGKKNIYDVKYRIKTVNGNYIWYYDKGGVVEFDSKGKPKKITGIVININEQIDFEKNISNQKSIINTLLESSYDCASVFVNFDGRIQFANKNAINLFNLKTSKVTDRTYDDLEWKITDLDGNLIKPDDLPFGIIKKQLISVKDYKHYIEDNDRKILLSVSGFPLYDNEKQFFGAIFNIKEEKDG